MSVLFSLSVTLNSGVTGFSVGVLGVRLTLGLTTPGVVIVVVVVVSGTGRL